MKTKLSVLKEYASSNDWQSALRIAAKFPRLGKEEKAIKRAHESFSNASFYTQLGYDIEKLRLDGINALVTKYKLN